MSAGTRLVDQAGSDAKILAPRVDYVVCTRNNRQVLAGTLGAIPRQGVDSYSCTVVDGRSTDGTPEFVRENYPFAEVIVKDVDSGPAASRNIGMSRGSAEWIVLVDSDVELCADWTEKQIAFMEKEGVDIACGKLVYASDPGTLNAAYGAMNRFTVCWNGGVGRPAKSFQEPRPCLWAITAAMALRRSALEKTGGFDELMFAFYEDCDFGWRSNLYGLRVAFNPAAVALHRVHSTMNKGSMGARITHLVYRNRIRAGLVNYQLRNVFRYVGPYLVLAMVDLVIRNERKAKLSALLWNLRNLGDTLRRRREVQRKRTVSDRDLWVLFESGIRGPGYDYQ